MADLYIRWSKANPEDVGDRPIAPCWPPNAVWTNASIWMSYPDNHPDPAKRGTTAYAARLGEQVLINVEASSRGATFPFPSDLAPVMCQMWACSGTNGVGPISSLASTNGQAGLEGIVLGELAPPDFYGVASALWTPDAADGLTFDSDGAAHVCLAANLIYTPPPNTAPPPAAQGQRLPQFISGGQPVRSIFPCGDGPVDPRSAAPIGHFQGQKNIQVWNITADPLLIPQIQVWGKGDADEAHVLTLSERTGRRTIDAAIREHVLAHPFIDLVGGRERRQRTREITPDALELLAPGLGEELLRAGTIVLEPRERAGLAGGGRLVLADDKDIALQLATRPLDDTALEGPTGDRGDEINVVAGPQGPAAVIVDLGAAREDRRGTIRVFDLAERDADNTLVGGTTFVTVVT